MLQVFDTLFTALHLLIIGFNMLGWIWPQTRRLHFASILVTAVFWIVIGIWYGFGYCPITDWQWQVKQKLGEENLPNSFIKYFADILTGKDLPASLIDSLTGAVFIMAAAASVYVNFISGSFTKVQSKEKNASKE